MNRRDKELVAQGRSLTDQIYSLLDYQEPPVVMGSLLGALAQWIVSQPPSSHAALYDAAIDMLLECRQAFIRTSAGLVKLDETIQSLNDSTEEAYSSTAKVFGTLLKASPTELAIELLDTDELVSLEMNDVAFACGYAGFPPEKVEEVWGTVQAMQDAALDE